LSHGEPQDPDPDRMHINKSDPDSHQSEKSVRMFLGILDPDPDPLVRVGSGSYYHQAKNLDYYCFLISLRIFFFKILL